MDYASLIHGLIDLYQAGLEGRWLQWAVELQEEMDSRFLDRDHGGYFSVHTDMADSVLRIKEDYDGAEPSPNSLAALNLVRLAAMLDREDWRKQAAQIFNLFGNTLATSPASVPMMVMAFDFHYHGKQQIVLAGDKSSAPFQALQMVINHQLRSNLVMLHADGGEGQKWLAAHNTALGAMQPVGGAPAAYVCQNYACQAPVTTPEALAKLINL